MMRWSVVLRMLPLIVLLSACNSSPVRDHGTLQRVSDELKQAAEAPPQKVPDAVSNALLPPITIALPKSSAKQLEQRFDLVINDAPAGQVLMGIVSGTRYSMLVHPDVKGNISVNLKDVTVFEALDAIRDMYKLEYTVEGTRIFVQPQAMQTRVFQVNYITGVRKGASDTRVTSGSVSDSNSGSQTGSVGSTTNGNLNSGNNNQAQISSSIATTSSTDFWSDLTASLNGIVGNEGGRRVVINPQSGIVVVHAMPADIRNVESFLHLMQISIERQVILEAKILSVSLNDSSQQGINWALFGNVGSNNFSVGNVNNGTGLSRSGGGALFNTEQGLVSSAGDSLINSSASLGSALGNPLLTAAATALGGPMFAVAVQGSNFAALMSFLETQGDVQVLSSPRIATINNQKAVLKVGNDEFFVTGVSTSTTASTGATTTVPEVELQPFFSGIALDVTPQIDRNDNIILHIHPSISQVSTVNKQINLGSNLSTINLPLASSDIRETDSIVRTRDGEVIVIGGLMTQAARDTLSKVPGVGDAPGVVGKAFRQEGSGVVKSELVILLKSTVVQGSQSWGEDILATQRRIEQMRRQAAEPAP